MIQKMNFSEGYFMNVQIMSTPCYLLETVELIYAFVNGVPAEARKSIFQDITQVIVIKQTIEHDF